MQADADLMYNERRAFDLVLLWFESVIECAAESAFTVSMNKSDRANVNLSPATQQFRLIPLPAGKHIVVNVFDMSKFYPRCIKLLHALIASQIWSFERKINK